MGDLGEVLSFWLSPGPALTIMGDWEVEQCMGKLCYLTLCLSNKMSEAFLSRC